MTDEEIINDAVSSSEQDDAQDDLEVTFLSPRKSSVKSEDALKSIDVSIRWAGENDAVDDTLLTLSNKKQAKIDNFFVKASSSASTTENVLNVEHK
ncbi:hypothetical protein FQA39_LY07996 [Lamprigera yunnana]|nr:hypothetical protein FQA39_LY07996 [Lamprigera yunnana]